jgi:hypothetical protein
MAVRMRRCMLGVAAAALALTSVVVTAGSAEAAPPPSLLGLPLPVVPPLAGNPTPLTDLVASSFRIGTGGTTRQCAVSGRGFPVYCVENVTIMPSALPTASGVTFGHWIYCKNVCAGSLLTHEMVHVAQFEQYGDTFGPTYLVEAALTGTGCENKWEKPAYQTGGTCL